METQKKKRELKKKFKVIFSLCILSHLTTHQVNTAVCLPEHECNYLYHLTTTICFFFMAGDDETIYVTQCHSDACAYNNKTS